MMRTCAMNCVYLLLSMRFVHAMQSNLQFASRHRYMYARVRNCRLDAGSELLRRRLPVAPPLPAALDP